MKKIEIVEKLIDVYEKMQMCGLTMKLAKGKATLLPDLQQFFQDMQEFCENHGKTIRSCYLSIIDDLKEKNGD